MNIMKKLYCFLFSLVISANIFAAQGLLWGRNSLRTVSTKWFDIIYTEDSSNSAKKLYENADEIYEDVGRMYGIEPQYRMPIVLTADVEIFNAYWSSGYFNHIVLYDTAISEDMSVFSEDLLSTFRHEVTHAFTYNLKDKFWKALSTVMGESVTGAGFLVTSGMAESATLTSESANGEGRLNSEYAKQMVRQAKIEKKFPGYNDIQGAADGLPSGSFYYFNGAFYDYIQKRFGMEKYAELWIRIVNPKDIAFEFAFKKVYGIKLSTAWKDFISSYYIPEVESNPVNANLVQDFFTPDSNNYSINNRRGSLYSSLSSSSTGLFYLDEQNDSVYFVDKNQLENNKISPKHLFTLNNTFETKVSSDGRFVALSYYDINSPNIKIRSAVYDVKQKTLYKLPGTGLKSVAVITNDDDYYIAGLNFHSQNKNLAIYKLDLLNDRISDCKEISLIKLPENTSISNLTDLGNGNFAFILREKLAFKIGTANINGTLLKKYELLQTKLELRNLSYNPENKELAFSIATPDQMPQLGKLSLETETFNLWKQNLSGGIFSPVIYNNKCYYIGNFYMENRLLEKSVSEIEFTSYNVKTSSFTINPIASENTDSLPYTNYNGAKYLFKGLLIPLSFATSVSFNPEQYGSVMLPLGFTYYNNNPWDSNSICLTAGYGYITNSFAVDFSYTAGTSTSLFNYGLDTSIEFDSKGFKQTTEQIYLNSGFYVGNHSTLSLGNSSVFHYGRFTYSPYTIFDVLLGGFSGGLRVSPAETNYLFASNQTQLTYSNVIRTGPGKYERLGFSTSGILSWCYNGSTGQNPDIFKNGGDLGFSTKFYIPKLLPLNSKQGIVTNLPSKVSINLFTSPDHEEEIGFVNDMLFTNSDFPALNLGSVTFSTVLFQKNIQKAIPFIFISDVQISFTYTAGFDYNKQAPSSDNWKVTQLGKYMDMIGNGTLPVVNVPYIKVTFGGTSSGGGSANADYKKLICFKAGCAISQNKIKPAYGFAMDIKF